MEKASVFFEMDTRTKARTDLAGEAARAATWLGRVTRALVADAALAEDLSQDALLRLLERPPREEGATRPWLRRALGNFVATHFRTRTRQRRLLARAPAPGAEATPEERVARRQLELRVAALVGTLPTELQRVLALRFEEDLDSAQIGARLGIPAGTARWRLKRALDALRDGLEVPPPRPGGRLRGMVPIPLLRAWMLGGPAPGALVPIGVGIVATVGVLIAVSAPERATTLAPSAAPVAGVLPVSPPPAAASAPPSAPLPPMAPGIVRAERRPPLPRPRRAAAPRPEARRPPVLEAPAASGPVDLAAGPRLRARLVPGSGPAGRIVVEQNARRSDARLVAEPGVASIPLRGALEVTPQGRSEPLVPCASGRTAGCLPISALATDSELAAITPDGTLRLKRWLSGARLRAIAADGGRLRVPVLLAGQPLLTVDWPVTFNPGPRLIFTNLADRGPDVAVDAEPVGAFVVFTVDVAGSRSWLVAPADALDGVRIGSRGRPGRPVRPWGEARGFVGDHGADGGHVRVRLRCAAAACSALRARLDGVFVSEGGLGAIGSSYVPTGPMPHPRGLWLGRPVGESGRPGRITFEEAP